MKGAWLMSLLAVCSYSFVAQDSFWLQGCVAAWPLLCALLASKWWRELWYFLCFSPCLKFWLIGVWKFSIGAFHGAVVLFRSREHENCGPQPGYVRAHIESEFCTLFRGLIMQRMRTSWDLCPYVLIFQFRKLMRTDFSRWRFQHFPS